MISQIGMKTASDDLDYEDIPFDAVNPNRVNESQVSISGVSNHQD